jgi:hypothetical protein
MPTRILNLLPVLLLGSETWASELQANLESLRYVHDELLNENIENEGGQLQQNESLTGTIKPSILKSLDTIDCLDALEGISPSCDPTTGVDATTDVHIDLYVDALFQQQSDNLADNEESILTSLGTIGSSSSDSKEPASDIPRASDKATMATTGNTHQLLIQDDNYIESLVNPVMSVHPKPNRVLVISNQCRVVEEVLKHYQVKSVYMFDIQDHPSDDPDNDIRSMGCDIGSKRVKYYNFFDSMEWFTDRYGSHRGSDDKKFSQFKVVIVDPSM